jgi:hypothetical protein
MHVGMCVYIHIQYIYGRDSSVNIATRYGLDGPGIESRWGKDIASPSRAALGPTQRPIQWVPGLPGLKQAGRGVDHPPHLGTRLKKEWSYTCTPIWAFVACSEVNFPLPLHTHTHAHVCVCVYIYIYIYVSLYDILMVDAEAKRNVSENGKI